MYHIKRSNVNILVSFTQIAECQKENKLNSVPKKKEQLQLVFIVIHSQIVDPHQKENKLSVGAFIMKLKVFLYEEIASRYSNKR